ncbi:hypothetical protein [Litchfieldia salsa]|uniref:Immunity protein 30 domain-containing protein n=1 Tax=Litchfieldia salsa TaxID=930152 RepID=A0A1H0X085_9BACI|nr:hypothetical protein [Litchfieldia salsa]SDP96361.1 hypothetical protein SAMN05216565_12129 [Litchfieldia salsa]
MDSRLKKQIEILDNSVLNEDFIDIAYDVIEDIETHENAFDAVEHVLNLIEQNPDIDFGSPGPLVHFVEQFYGNGYEDKLVQSIERFPTSHTVWMLNRIINDSEGEKKEKKKFYLNVLQNVLHSHNCSDELRSITNEFLSLHN